MPNHLPNVNSTNATNHLILLYSVTSFMSTDDTPRAPPGNKQFTPAALAEFNGSDPEKPVYLGIKGTGKESDRIGTWGREEWRERQKGACEKKDERRTKHLGNPQRSPC